MTNKELRILDEMLTNLEIWSTWNKTFANEMIGLGAKIRNLLADRKTESGSEKPNNCEVKNYCDDCLYTDTCDDKAFFYACTSKATISKMEQVDKDINVRSKDEPQTERSE